jgi:hypothetical protein
VEFDFPENAIMEPTVGPRNNAHIPSEGPLPIADLNPVFVKIHWWQFWKWVNK